MRFWYIHNVQTIQKYVLCHCWTHLCLKLSLKWLNRYFPLPVFVMMCEFLKNKMFFHMSSWKGMWTFSTCYMNYGEKASALIKAFTWWVMKLWMAQTWYCNICTWDWCNSGQSRIWSHVGKGSCKIQNSELFCWLNAPLPTPYIQLRTYWEDVYRCWVCFQGDVVVAIDGY